MASADDNLAVGKESCAAADMADDSYSLLQGGAFLSQKDESNVFDVQKDATGDVEIKKHTEIASQKGPFDDVMKGISNAVGGFGSFKEAFEKVKAKVLAFKEEAMKISEKLLKEVVKTTKEGLGPVSAKVQVALTMLKTKAAELADSLEKAKTAFASSFASALPKDFTSQIEADIDATAKEVRKLEKGYEAATTKLASTKVDDVCPVVKQVLEQLEGEKQALVDKASPLTKEQLQAKLDAVLEKLPAAIKEKVSDVINKATEASSELVKVMPESMHAVSKGVTHSFQGTCKDLPAESASLRLQISSLAIALCAARALAF